MRYLLPVSSYGPDHEDFLEISQISKAILHRMVNVSKLAEELGILLRNCIDHVIDTPHTGRCDYEDLEKTEKTYLGTRVEIRLRSLLRFPKGKLDLRIADRDVDIKFTIGSNWMIPSEAVNQICILVAADEARAWCYFGLLKARLEYLTPSTNKDGKRSVSAAGFSHINWLVSDRSYPPNFWRAISKEKRALIFSQTGGTRRLVTLFEVLQGIPIHRSVVESVAQQKDYMKRLRANGGARDELLRRGIAVYSGKYDSSMIEELGLPHCDSDYFISTRSE